MEEIDLKELFEMFWKKKIDICIITLIFAIAGIVYSYFYLKPEYKAASSLVLVQNTSQVTQQGEGSSITSTDLTMNSKLVSTYSELIKTNAVLGQVAKNLDIPEKNLQKIKDKISVNAKQDTEIIEIVVKDKDPNFAAKIANEIATVFSEKIVDIYNISNIYLLDMAEAETKPCNINHVKDIVIFAAIGLIVSAGYILVLNLLDYTIKSEHDIESIDGLTILGAIPFYEAESKRQNSRKIKSKVKLLDS